MGMFDYLRCEYELPIQDAPIDGWQTKDTPAQSLDVYTIRRDGTIWGQEYDIEDRSDPKAEGLMALRGCMTRVNIREVPLAMTGEVRFYTQKQEEPPTGWIEFSAYFNDGKLQLLNLIENR